MLKMKAWIGNANVILNETERVQFERIYARGVEKLQVGAKKI